MILGQFVIDLAAKSECVCNDVRCVSVIAIYIVKSIFL